MNIVCPVESCATVLQPVPGDAGYGQRLEDGVVAHLQAVHRLPSTRKTRELARNYLRRLGAIL